MTCRSEPMTTRNKAAPDLDRAQQHLTELLLAKDRDPQAIAEAAEDVRRAERQAAAAERGR